MGRRDGPAAPATRGADSRRSDASCHGVAGPLKICIPRHRAGLIPEQRTDYRQAYRVLARMEAGDLSSSAPLIADIETLATYSGIRGVNRGKFALFSYAPVSRWKTQSVFRGRFSRSECPSVPGERDHALT